ncbi:hypothetical protein SPRG_19826 [Saprolegnia parasitica CBS 223.65]|uniref:Transmembrane protein 65 n=1 Tax=Saprolegnia parasitica (strain CBS 223.65) TaxID=695850 RepID=A0A067CU19_SAPPC|nr:hypothetical protein SPRG_19826 [Saprolegnia parasitica CBS 223.65]KDO30277.1 hypothetical protein SPRG_19826 [Saprolegnia parasitica CBS 223.65]|eukprot:XP_012199076.1 hypothetical protein SPRG_19826 [Saprolegnia parasitica CBS 223.65]
MLWRNPRLSGVASRLARAASTTTTSSADANRAVLQRLAQATDHELSLMAQAIDAGTVARIQALLPATTVAVPPPSKAQLRQVMVRSMVPFIGFGFVDNFILIIAGDYIDTTLGVSLGISTMAAAGIGNTISDVAGIGLGGVIEDCAARMGLADPKLLKEQLDMRVTRVAHYTGCTIGVVIGCMLGMAPLLFLETKEDLQAKATLDVAH